MPRKKSSKTVAPRKKQHDPKSPVAFHQTRLAFQAEAPLTPPSSPDSSSSASPPSVASFPKDDRSTAAVRLAVSQDDRLSPRKTPQKPPSPMKRERTEEIEGPPSPMKKEKGEATSTEKADTCTVDSDTLKSNTSSKAEKSVKSDTCSKEKSVKSDTCSKENSVKSDTCSKAQKSVKSNTCSKTGNSEKSDTCSKGETEKLNTFSKAEKSVKSEQQSCLKTKSPRSESVRATLDDYFGCSPSHSEAVKSDGRSRRSKSAAPGPRKTKADLSAFSLDKHFPIQRRSSRRDEKILKEMTAREIQRRVLNNVEEGLKVTEFDLKGRGVVATRSFDRDEFVVEYAGNLVTDAEAKRLNARYAEDPEVGSYMFWIVHRGKNLCVDATAESGRLGRLINHSRTASNLKPKVVEYNGKPRLLFFTTRQIFPGEELLYDYGDRDKKTLADFPWLKS